MKILIAEDDPISGCLLEEMLVRWGYEVIVTGDGAEAWRALEGAASPPLAILDWMMPGLDGVEVCRRVRAREHCPYTYLILLTAKGDKEDLMAGLGAGADDYLIKPFDHRELRARLKVGERVLALEQSLAKKISEQNQAEAEHRRLEQQLFLAQKIESVGTLAGGVAHDFNNLLTAVLGNTRLARKRLQPGDPLQEFLEDVEDAGNRAASLTRQLLAFSRRQQLERKTINLNDTIGEFMKMLRRIIGEDIEVRVQTASNLSPVFADPGQIEQVVMNLAVNARDAMPGGGLLLIETHDVVLGEDHCRTHQWVKPGQYVQLIMSDTGAGMDAQTQQRIFEPFFTTKEVGKGTGLGLSVIYGIIKQHGGYVDVYSEVGCGTTFKIYLPVAEQRAEETTHEAQPALIGGTETILLAEDEPALRKLAHRCLDELGYRVLVARDGEEAVEAYLTHQAEIDMVILDLVMPRMGGREAHDRIRALGSEVPVMFVTGYSAELAKSQFIGESGAALMQKPYNVDALGGKVREVLDQARERRRSQAKHTLANAVPRA